MVFLVVSLYMANTKPFVAAAFICEKILREDNIYSAIRIVDTYTVTTVTLGFCITGRTAITSASDFAPTRQG